MSHKEVYKFIKKYKKNYGCLFCRESGLNKLTFHHRNPKEKLFSLGKVNLHFRDKQIILNEIGKCTIVCFSCHTFFYHKRYSKYSHEEPNGKCFYYEQPKSIMKQILMI